MISNLPYFDNNLKTYDERLQYVQNVINHNSLSEIQLESFADYLLTSVDIESNRKIDYKFWLNQNQFKQYGEHKNVMLADSMVIDAYENGNSIMDIVQQDNRHDDKLTNEYIDSMFCNLSTPNEVKRIIKGYHFIQRNNHDLRISTNIEYVIDNVFNSLEFGRDLLIVNWLLNGRSQKEIACKLNISESTVHKRLKKISEKTIREMV